MRLISASFIIFRHQAQNSLDDSAACGALVNFELTRQAFKEIGAHGTIIPVRFADSGFSSKAAPNKGHGSDENINQKGVQQDASDQ